MPLNLPHLILASIKKPWETSPVLKELSTREGLDEHCGICEYKAVCGGCRARAYGYFGNYKAADPGCINNKESFLMLKNANER